LSQKDSPPAIHQLKGPVPRSVSPSLLGGAGGQGTLELFRTETHGINWR
jgi:hypothetical protein